MFRPNQFSAFKFRPHDRHLHLFMAPFDYPKKFAQSSAKNTNYCINIVSFKQIYKIIDIYFTGRYMGDLDMTAFSELLSSHICYRLRVSKSAHDKSGCYSV